MTPTECTYFFFTKEQANSSRLIHDYSENEFDTARHFIVKKVSVDFLFNALLTMRYLNFTKKPLTKEIDKICRRENDHSCQKEL